MDLDDSKHSFWIKCQQFYVAFPMEATTTGNFTVFKLEKWYLMLKSDEFMELNYWMCVCVYKKSLIHRNSNH